MDANRASLGQNEQEKATKVSSSVFTRIFWLIRELAAPKSCLVVACVARAKRGFEFAVHERRIQATEEGWIRLV